MSGLIGEATRARRVSVYGRLKRAISAGRSATTLLLVSLSDQVLPKQAMRFLGHLCRVSHVRDSFHSSLSFRTLVPFLLSLPIDATADDSSASSAADKCTATLNPNNKGQQPIHHNGAA